MVVIHKTDGNGYDRYNELNSLAVGTTIRIATESGFVQSMVTSNTYASDKFSIGLSTSPSKNSSAGSWANNDMFITFLTAGAISFVV